MNIDEYKALSAEPKAEVVTEVVTEVVEQKTEEVIPEVVTYDVDGKSLTSDELIKGYLRQSDYTKKTTSLSQQKKDYKEALAVYNMVQSDPNLQAKLKEAGGDEKLIDAANIEHKRIRDLEVKIAGMELDTQINDLKRKYPDFDEVKVIHEAAERSTTDLEFVYKATRKDKEVDKTMDKEALKAELMKEIMAEMKGEVEIPTTIIDGKVTKNDITENKGPTMSAQEVKIANGLGISHEEYIKNRG